LQMNTNSGTRYIGGRLKKNRCHKQLEKSIVAI
jgi:hypothetical protein